MSSLLDFFKNLFRPKPATSSTASPSPATRPAQSPEPAAIVVRKVLMIVYNPIIDPSSQLRLSQKLGWNRVDDLSAGFLSDILELSGGLARYQIVQRIEVDEFPVKKDGFRYTAQGYLDVVSRKTPPHQPDNLNYDEFLKKFNILQRVAANEIDEVWVFAFPYAGFYESAMGGAGAFWLNAPPLENTVQCPRKFVVMGFSYERHIGEMMESYGHRIESTMERVYARHSQEKNLWKKFIRYDQSHPGQAECGNIHFAPNSEKDYDWGNQRFVESYCDDWFNFPNFKGVKKQVNCAEWGNGDMRAHHKWWFQRIPKVAGRTDGVAHNWWQYIVDVNRVA